jgi:hypothetical protein
VREAALRAIEVVESRLNAVVGGPYDDSSTSRMGRWRECRSRSRTRFRRPGARWASARGCWRASWHRVTPRWLSGSGGRPDLAGAQRDARVRVQHRHGAGRHGPTRNPWSPEHSPGGSSGGSAALVASRAVPMAHANDGGGWIRIPAAWCGLVGLKPSCGRVPLGPAVGEAVGGFARLRRPDGAGAVGTSGRPPHARLRGHRRVTGAGSCG